MKMFLIVIMCLMAACSKTEEHKMSSKNEGNLFIEDSILTFGHVDKNNVKTISCVCNIKNTGKSPVAIVDTYVSCGCLFVKIPSKPIMPEETITVPIKINTVYLLGTFNKSVVLYTGTKAAKIIRIKGEITN